MDYYNQKQIIARVDKKGNVIGQIEKWEAHRKGILHQALTVALIYKDQYILQHRKHPAFDGVFDVTSSSHQLFVNGKLQKTIDAVYDTLQREWGLSKNDLSDTPKEDGAVYYKAKDQYSEFMEHEYCYIYSVSVRELPIPKFDFAYGSAVVSKQELRNKKSRLYKNLAPWVQKMIEKNLL